MKNNMAAYLHDEFVDTIRRCDDSILAREDEFVMKELFAEFNIGYSTFLHENNLNILLEDGYIDENIMSLSLAVREFALSLESDETWNIDSVRNGPEWRELFRMCAHLRDVKRDFDQRRAMQH